MLDRSLEAVTDVLATTPHVMFCVKSVDGEYLAANQAFADRAGLLGPGDVVGRTARDLFPAELAERYEAQDRRVIETGRMLTNELELITRPDRSVGWFLTSKSRWTDDAGVTVGVVSVSVDLRTHGRRRGAPRPARRRGRGGAAPLSPSRSRSPTSPTPPTCRSHSSNARLAVCSG